MADEPLAFSPDQFSGIARVFPLPNLVMFPHVMQALHVFEPRYRALFEEAIERADDLLLHTLRAEAGVLRVGQAIARGLHALDGTRDEILQRRFVERSLEAALLLARGGVFGAGRVGGGLVPRLVGCLRPRNAKQIVEGTRGVLLRRVGLGRVSLRRILRRRSLRERRRASERERHHTHQRGEDEPVLVHRVVPWVVRQ